MEIKYEAVFGPQELFDGAPEDAEYAGWFFCQEVRWYMILNGKILFSDGGIPPSADGGTWCTSDNPYLSADIAAMRRIIKTPVWTVADQQAGRLPEVGSKLIYTETRDEFEFVGVIAGSKRWACKDACDGLLYFFESHEITPIESPEEKAARLREEWKNNVIEIHHGKRRKMSTSTFLLDDIYDALLSGELQAPKGGE